MHVAYVVYTQYDVRDLYVTRWIVYIASITCTYRVYISYDTTRQVYCWYMLYIMYMHLSVKVVLLDYKKQKQKTEDVTTHGLHLYDIPTHTYTLISALHYCIHITLYTTIQERYTMTCIHRDQCKVHIFYVSCSRFFVFDMHVCK